jgi:phosphinothricin acetyltransferase
VPGLLHVRPADPDRDAAACAAIYAPYVDPGPASFEERPPGAAEVARRIREAHAWLVAEDGDIVGYAYASPHRARAAYRWAVDVAVYVDAEHTGRGAGHALYGALLPELARRGFRVACAGIALPNDASVALHERHGFRLVGVYERIGYKAGAWRDVGWWQLQLAPTDEAAPAEPV